MVCDSTQIATPIPYFSVHLENQMKTSNLAGKSRPVVIKPYDPNWPELFQTEAKLIQETIAPFITTIHHIGSTSVPGLAAKPIIDMLIGLNKLSDSVHFAPLLINIGYRYFPEHEVEMPERRYFSKIINSDMGYHLHMVEPDSEFFRRHLAFRDYLRVHPDAVADYAALKIKLAEEYGSDREGYTDAKSDFIKEIEQKALNSGFHVTF